ncbi:hypothetical protein JCM10450v2_004274 [Rhodotorula kratochvilovae]
MQSAPRLLRTSLLRQVPRTQASQPAPFATPSSSAPYSSFAPYAPAPSASSSAPYTPSLRFPTSDVRGSSSRGFASSAPAQATHSSDNNPFQDTAPLFERVQQSPEVLAAIENMARVTREKTGVDLAAGDKPSMSMMLKLAHDPDLRAAAEALMAALRGAGVEVDPKVALQALQMMGGDGFDKLKGGLEGYHEKVRKGEGEDGDGEGKK